MSSTKLIILQRDLYLTKLTLPVTFTQITDIYTMETQDCLLI